MKINDFVKQYLTENFSYNGKTGDLVMVADGSNAIVMRRGRMKVLYRDSKEMTSIWLDAASVCWFLWKNEWPEYGIVFDRPKQCPASILQDWNLKKRKRADYMRNEQVVTTKEFLKVVQDVVLERFRDVCNNIKPGDDTQSMLMNATEVIPELARLLKEGV